MNQLRERSTTIINFNFISYLSLTSKEALTVFISSTKEEGRCTTMHIFSLNKISDIASEKLLYSFLT